MFESTTSTPSFFDSYYPILVGIFGVCSLFLIIFTIYVSIHIHTKCAKRKKSKLRHKTSFEHSDVYQEINELDTSGNVTKYDPLSSTKPSPNRKYEADVSRSHDETAGPSFITENLHEYSEVNNKERVPLQSFETHPSICEKESRYISALTSSQKPNQAEFQQKIEVDRKSLTGDRDDYILPTSEGAKRERSKSPCTSPNLSTNGTYTESVEATDEYSTINDDTVNVYLTVIPN
jgi:hypothetical protein